MNPTTSEAAWLIVDEVPVRVFGPDTAGGLSAPSGQQGLRLAASAGPCESDVAEGWRPVAELVQYARDVQSGAIDRWLGRHVSWKSHARRTTAPLRLAFRGGLEALARGARLDIEVVRKFDDRVDEVWAHARHEYRVIGERSAEALASRFDRGGPVLNRVYLESHGHVVGYFVLQTHLRNGVFVSELVDFLSPEAWLLPLFTECILYAHETHSAALVLSASGPHVQLFLRSLGFDPRNRDHILARTARGRGSAMTLPRAEQWFLTGVDRPRSRLDRVRGA